MERGKVGRSTLRPYNHKQEKGEIIMNTITINQQDTEKLYKLGLHELTNNHIRFAKKYFEKAALQGHEYANRYFMYLCFEKDKTFARDVILCAERRV